MKKVTLLVIVVTVFLAGQLQAGDKKQAVKLDSVECPSSSIIFDDGDSFSCDGEQIRVLGVDAPEITHESHGIFIDQPFGRKAAALTEKLLKNANHIMIIRDGKDPYGRTLAHVLVDGELLGVTLIRAGLAYENVSRYGDNGLPEFALQISEAWKVAPRPTFENPHDWRKKNQKK